MVKYSNLVYTKMISIIIIMFGAIIVWKLINKYKKRMRELKEELKKTQFELRSSRVKFGKSFEHFVPLIKNFPGDKEKTVFLGMPIDFICFDEEAIKFVEVKTNKSKLNNNERRIKNLILNKKVEWHELRYTT